MIGRRRKDRKDQTDTAVGEPQRVDPDYDDAAVEHELAVTDTEVDGLREMLQQLLEPDTGLEQRTYDAVQQTLLDRETMMTVASLFNLGWRTPKVILMESESPDGS